MIRWAVLLFAAAALPAATHDSDVVVYGGTAGGVMAAVSAARQGLRTALVEPGGHLGGMVSGGLGRTDYGRKEAIGGFALEFCWRVGMAYHMDRYGNEVAWLHEPHVAEEIFRQLIAESGVSLFEHQRLAQPGGVRRQGTALQALRVEDGSEFTGRVFIDASYEGDVMAQSGVTYTVGREAASHTANRWPERATVPRSTSFWWIFRRATKAGGCCRKFPAAPRKRRARPTSRADVQLPHVLQRAPENQCPLPGRPGMTRALHAAGQADCRAHGRRAQSAAAGHAAFRSTAFPTASRHQQQRRLLHRLYRRQLDLPGRHLRRARRDLAGAQAIYPGRLFYFLAHDQQLPAALRAEMNHWGSVPGRIHRYRPLAAPALHPGRPPDGRGIRDGAAGSANRSEKPDPIGMGSYNSDSHNVQRFVDARGFVRNEGDMQVPVQPYQIPYRILTPSAGRPPTCW